MDEVLVCENEAAKERFEAKRAALLAAGKPTDEIWVFHGTPTQVCAGYACGSVWGGTCCGIQALQGIARVYV